MIDRDDHATGNHVCSVHDYFRVPNLKDDNVPLANKLRGCEALEANRQRHEVQRLSTNKTAARIGHTSKTTCENIAIENFGVKFGDLVSSIDWTWEKTRKEQL